MNVVRFASWLREDGHEVAVLGVEGSPLWKRAKALDMQTLPIAHHRKYADLGNARKLAKTIDELLPDFIWIRDTRDMSICGWAKVFAHHNCKVIYQQAMQLGVNKKDPFHTARFKAIDHWISPLEFLAKQVTEKTRFPEERIHVIPLAIEPERFMTSASKPEAREMLDLPLEPLLIGNIGRIDPLKDQMILIDTLPELRESAGNVHVVITGEPTLNEGSAYFDALHAKVDALNLHEYVHFRPFRNDVETAFAALDVFAMTSVGETFGMVTIEAMASALPIIGTNSSGTPEILGSGECGVLYTPEDRSSFVQAVLPLLRSREMRDRLSRSARRKALRAYSRKAVIQKINSEILNT